MNFRDRYLTRLTHFTPSISPRLLRYRLLGAALALTAVSTSACDDDDDDDGPTGNTNIQGQYNISSVTGPDGTDDTSPFVITEGPVTDPETGVEVTVRLEIPSGFVQLNSGGRFTTSTVLDVFANDIRIEDISGVITSEGSYTVTGSTVTLIEDDDPDDDADDDVADRTTTAVLSGNTITVSDNIDADGDPTTADVPFQLVATKQ